MSDLNSLVTIRNFKQEAQDEFQRWLRNAGWVADGLLWRDGPGGRLANSDGAKQIQEARDLAALAPPASLSDEQVWLAAYCAGIAQWRGAHDRLGAEEHAESVADNTIDRFRRRFPVAK